MGARRCGGIDTGRPTGDRPATELYQDHVEKAVGDFALPDHPLTDKANSLGLANEDMWLLTGVGGLYTYGALTDDARAKRAA